MPRCPHVSDRFIYADGAERCGLAECVVGTKHREVDNYEKVALTVGASGQLAQVVRGAGCQADSIANGFLMHRLAEAR